MPTTYTPLATTTLGSATASVTINSIPSTYTDLVLVVAGANGGNNFYMRPNGDTNSRYSVTYLQGDGSTAESGRFNTGALGGNGMLVARGQQFSATNTNITTCVINIMNYSNATTFKTVISRAGTAAASTGALVNLYQNTAAITQLECYPFAANWAVGTTFSLYGVASAAVVSGAKATGGDVVATDGTYWYHAFRASGTFTPTQALTCDVLVVAGGGWGNTSGAGRIGGGGGAGGLLAHTSQSLSTTGYTVTVGGGGGSYSNGSNSQFASLTASVGGGLGGNAGAQGSSGGSGGGGGDAIGAGGAGTAGQGNTGGNGQNSSGGGGGGAGATGSNGTSSTNGKGGAGVNTYSTWANATGTGDNGYFAGGGGGGLYMASGTGTTQTAALGGGGIGGTYWSGVTQQAATAGRANTGGGGGGYGLGAGGASGGSGIVIVRYAV